MTRDDVVKEISELPGVGKKKAEALYDAGYTSIAKLKQATKDDLLEVEGVGPKLAEAILKGLAELEAPEPEQAIEVVEAEEAPEEKRKAKAKEEVEIVEEAEKVYQAKAKPELSDEKRHALWLRGVLNRHTPSFPRDQWWRYPKIDRDHWRKPRGARNKQRKEMGYRPRMPGSGYGGPRLVRGLHPSGFEEVLVQNVAELDRVDPKTQAARIGGAVGAKKREAIVEAAGDKGIRILNPGRGSK